MRQPGPDWQILLQGQLPPMVTQSVIVPIDVVSQRLMVAGEQDF